MPAANSTRKRLLVDMKVQHALVIRVILYWFMCLASVAIMILAWRLATDPSRGVGQHLTQMWYQFGAAVIGSLLLLPLVIYDTLVISNRFVGPLQHLRGQMRRLARGEKVDPIKFRQDDFWHELSEEFNALTAHLEDDTSSETAEPRNRPFTRQPVLSDIGH